MVCRLCISTGLCGRHNRRTCPLLRNRNLNAENARRQNERTRLQQLRDSLSDQQREAVRGLNRIQIQHHRDSLNVQGRQAEREMNRIQVQHHRDSLNDQERAAEREMNRIQHVTRRVDVCENCGELGHTYMHCPSACGYCQSVAHRGPRCPFRHFVRIALMVDEQLLPQQLLHTCGRLGGQNNNDSFICEFCGALFYAHEKNAVLNCCYTNRAQQRADIVIPYDPLPASVLQFIPESSQSQTLHHFGTLFKDYSRQLNAAFSFGSTKFQVATVYTVVYFKVLFY